MTTTESSELPPVTPSSGEAEVTLEGGDCRVTVRGPEYSDDHTRWPDALNGAFEVWHQMHKAVHEARLGELRAEQNARPGPASAGFISEQSSERRNGMLPGGTGAMPT